MILIEIVTWKEAQTVCSVPFVNDIVYTENNYSGLPTTFSAWTSSTSVNHTSDWTSFYGNYVSVISSSMNFKYQ